MGRYKTDTLSDLERHGYWVRVLCRCGNNATLRPAMLMVRYRGLKRVDGLADRLKCKLCGRRPYDVHPTFAPEG